MTASDAQRELKILSEQANLDFVGNIPTVTAQVVDTTSSNFEMSIQINRGTDSGIAVNMPVVTGGGLVGRIAAVSATHATVLLLTDPTFSVGVRLTTNGATFVADGAGRGNPLNLELVDATTQINVGDKLVTSGLNLAQYPKDIPVATVKTREDGSGPAAAGGDGHADRRPLPVGVRPGAAVVAPVVTVVHGPRGVERPEDLSGRGPSSGVAR